MKGLHHDMIFRSTEESPFTLGACLHASSRAFVVVVDAPIR